MLVYDVAEVLGVLSLPLAIVPHIYFRERDKWRKNQEPVDKEKDRPIMKN